MRRMIDSKLFSITALELATGFSSDLLRKWRRRYGFPKPINSGKLCYDAIQLDQLRLIRMLLDQGFRPAQVVGKMRLELEQLVDTASTCLPPSRDQWMLAIVDDLKRYDIGAVRHALQQARAERTLSAYIDEIIMPFTLHIGTAWARQELEIHHEHICTGIVSSLLKTELQAIPAPPGAPSVLLGTPPMEQHVLGILMAECVLAEAGANCLNLGAQLPANEMAMAAIGCRAEIVGVSFSFSYPRDAVRPWLAQMRKLLPAEIELWAGGAGTAAIRRSIPGVRVFSDLDSARIAIFQRRRPTPQA